MATDRERRLLVTIATAIDARADAQQRLNDALVAGEDSAPIRAEIEAIDLRAVEADRAIRDIRAAAETARSRKLGELAAGIVAAVSARIDGRLGGFPPRPKRESHLPRETTL
jgi:hypothetical protein